MKTFKWKIIKKANVKILGNVSFSLYNECVYCVLSDCEQFVLFHLIPLLHEGEEDDGGGGAYLTLNNTCSFSASQQQPHRKNKNSLDCQFLCYVKKNVASSVYFKTQVAEKADVSTERSRGIHTASL